MSAEAEAKLTTEIVMPGRFKPSKCAGRDEFRPLLTRAAISERDGRHYLVTTDSYRLLAVPIDVDGEVPTELLLTPSMLRAIEDAHPSVPRTFTVDDESVRICDARYDRQDDVGQFPDVNKIWPEVPEDATSISLNVNQLKGIADGLGTESVTITITAGGPYRPLVVEPSAPNGGRALLMPMRGD